MAHILGYFLYYQLSNSGEIKPNSTSWSIWTFGSMVNLITYASISDSWMKDLLPAVCSVSCVVLYINCLKNGYFRRPKLVDILIITVDVIATVVWLTTKSAVLGNIIIQFSTAISFIPILRETFKNPLLEKPTPWIIWTFAYGLDIILLIKDFNGFSEVVYPVTCLVLHFSVFALSMVGRKRTKRSGSNS